LDEAYDCHVFSRRALLSVGVGLGLIFSSTPVVSSASELSDAQRRYGELQVTYAANIDALNGWLSKSESDSQACIDRLAGATTPADTSSRQECQNALNRFQAYKETLKKENDEIKVELAALESQFPTLKPSSPGGSVPVSGGASAPVGGSTLPSVQVSPTPTASPSPVSSLTPTPTVTPSATPTPSTSSPAASPIATTPTATPNVASTPTTSPSVSPTPSTVQKVTPAPKPAVKKKTIICAKGKVTKKVTAVKPVCPKGFKVQKTK
jgi:hypothetical protein